MRKSSNLAVLAAVVLSANSAVAAQMVDLLALPKYGDSSLMSFNRREESGTLPLVTFGLPSPVPSFTTVFWTCVDWISVGTNLMPFVSAMISTEPALYVSEGGDYSPDLLGDAYWPVERGGLGATLPLSSTGTWSANCLPASYDMPEDFAARDDWQYGCYTLNIITDTDLTVTVGGEERNIAASNEMQQVVFLCVSSDRSITVAAADADAEVYLCAAESPLRQFHDMSLFDISTSTDFWGAPERSLTNEWRMVVMRGAIVQGGAAVELNALTFAAVDPSPIEDSTSTKELWRPRADRCFARHSRIEFRLFAGGSLKNLTGKYIRQNVWGVKIYPEWLDDDLILSIRDKDWAEMQRRGFSTHHQFSP
ncbi:MAG: hypothetical protein II823_07120 [Kiritimatiellae bacterium]|nr:hypothetical protein [Kiritimatiellia bacterium]